MPYNGSISEAFKLAYTGVVTKSSYSYFFSNTLPVYWNNDVPAHYSTSSTTFVQYTMTSADAFAVAASTMAAVPGALGAFHNVANVSFTTGSNTSSDIVISELSRRLYLYDTTNTIYQSEIGGYANPPAASSAPQIVKQRASDFFILPGTHSMADTLTRITQHELSHSIGLKDANASGIAAAADNGAFTIMSYKPHTGEAAAIIKELQLYDIAALQSIYGRNDAYAAGDTIYNSFVETAGDRVGHDRIFSIWDGAGTDTIDASSLAVAALIDLRPGHFSSLGPDSGVAVTPPSSATGTPTVTEGLLNVSIAFGAYIENATGTSKNDLIIGNLLSNYLVGGGGNDVIYGEGYSSAYNPGDGDYSRVTNTGTKIVAASLSPTAQHDFLDGGAGDDFLVGSRGGDVLKGRDGHDILIGNGGLDTLSGGDGNDILYGYNPQVLEYGAATFSGGTGSDTFYCSGGGNVILDLDSGDKVFVHGIELHGGTLSNVPQSNQYYDGTYNYAWNPNESTLYVSSTSSYGVFIYDFQNGEAGIYLDNMPIRLAQVVWATDRGRGQFLSWFVHGRRLHRGPLSLLQYAPVARCIRWCHIAPSSPGHH